MMLALVRRVGDAVLLLLMPLAAPGILAGDDGDDPGRARGPDGRRPSRCEGRDHERRHRSDPRGRHQQRRASTPQAFRSGTTKSAFCCPTFSPSRRAGYLSTSTIDCRSMANWSSVPWRR